MNLLGARVLNATVGSTTETYRNQKLAALGYELSHSSALMLDDINDESLMRRNKPTSHTIYGRGMTIHAALFLTLLIQKTFADTGNMQLAKTIPIVSDLVPALEIHTANTEPSPVMDTPLIVIGVDRSSLTSVSFKIYHIFPFTF